MKHYELKPEDIVEFSEMKIISINEDSGNLQIVYCIDEIFPEYNYLSLIKDGETRRLVYKSKVIIDLLDVTDVLCEDWMRDENIPRTSINQPDLRWNENEEIVEFNYVRTIGEGLVADYSQYIDLEFARILSISAKKINENQLFEMTLNASYTKFSNDKRVLDFHTGPFEFYSKKVVISTD
jgi:hypothetical protein